MLTLKYVDQDGNEFISEHDQIDTDRHEVDNRLRVFGRSVGSLPNDYERMYIAPMDYDRLNVTAPMPYGRHTCFVMNRHGATVATYRL